MMARLPTLPEVRRKRRGYGGAISRAGRIRSRGHRLKSTPACALTKRGDAGESAVRVEWHASVIRDLFFKSEEVRCGEYGRLSHLEAMRRLLLGIHNARPALNWSSGAPAALGRGRVSAIRRRRDPH